MEVLALTLTRRRNMPETLADTIRGISEQAESEAIRSAQKEQFDNQLCWEEQEKLRADEIICKLPEILRKAAGENHKDGPYCPEFGHRKYRVLTLDPAHRVGSGADDLRGAAAHINSWALANGFRVEVCLDIDVGADWSGYYMYITW
jgi:hypothetical protein